jgi:NAD(P)-dependent dehydrogenase (short-subunit alcohol dehydrogenase family)
MKLSYVMFDFADLHGKVAVVTGASRGLGRHIAIELARRGVQSVRDQFGRIDIIVNNAGSLLREVKRKGVKITTVTPGIIDTYFGGGTEGTKEETWSLGVLTGLWIED